MFNSITEEEVEKIWKGLVKKFREEHSSSKKYCPSGSQAINKKTWEFYDSMLWLIPHVSHLPQIASDTLLEDECNESTNKTKEDKELYERFKRKRCENENENDLLSELLANNNQVLKNMEKLSQDGKAFKEETNVNAVDKYMPLLNNGFSQVPDTKKFKCSREMIRFIVNFKKNISN